jgi:hypothetical protein
MKHEALSQYEYMCPKCNGDPIKYRTYRDEDGRVRYYKGAWGDPVSDSCDECRGKGYKLTEEGKQLLGFISTHMVGARFTRLDIRKDK